MTPTGTRLTFYHVAGVFLGQTDIFTTSLIGTGYNLMSPESRRRRSRTIAWYVDELLTTAMEMRKRLSDIYGVWVQKQDIMCIRRCINFFARESVSEGR